MIDESVLPIRRGGSTGHRAFAMLARVFAALAAVLLGTPSASADSIETRLQLCASCHGRNGLPSDRTVPIIWGQQTAYLRKQLNDYRDGDRDSQIMSSIAESLSDGEISQIVTHFGDAKWPEQSTFPQPAAPAALATCKACHNASLTGGASPAGAAPRLAGQDSPYLNDTMTKYADGERANSSVMSELMKDLSPADRKAMADYLAAMR